MITANSRQEKYAFAAYFVLFDIFGFELPITNRKRDFGRRHHGQNISFQIKTKCF